MKHPGMDPSWTCWHFSLSNPKGKRQGDLPMLLRRLATRIAELGENAMILDVTIRSCSHTWLELDGAEPTATIVSGASAGAALAWAALSRLAGSSTRLAPARVDHRCAVVLG